MNKAFTLSEILITLGIIGIVASLTLPTIINNKKHKELETAFKKSHSTLAQAVLRVVNEDYGGTAPTINGPESLDAFIKQLQKYIIKSATCDPGKTCSTSIFPVTSNYAFQEFLRSNYKTFNGGTPDIICNDRMMALNDGSFLFFNSFALSSEVGYEKTLICVDTNGWKKKPNKYGHDFFMFQVNENGQLLPMGADGTVFSKDLCSLTSNSPSNGYGCTAKAISEKDYFKILP